MIKDDSVNIKNLQLFHKPTGISTHSPSTKVISPNDRVIGFIDLFSQPLYICQRLDKETSGAILLAKTSEAARFFTEKLISQQVKKEYYFITNKPQSKKEFHIKGYIQKKNNSYHLLSSGRDSEFSETRFFHIKTSGSFHLWRAIPVTGKTHQIRIHAQSSGISILGDSLYGGAPHCRLFLHCYKLTYDGQEFLSPIPHLMEEMNLLNNKNLSTMICSVERRKNLYPQIFHDPMECLRLIHSEHPVLRCDKFGSTLWFYWYGDNPPTQEDLSDCQYISSFCRKESWFLRVMANRGTHPNTSSLWHNGSPLNETNPPQNIKSWVAQENGLSYGFRSQSGLSPGLFLDQRANRKWIKENSSDKKVLNLFAYTSGFSLAAAKGGAKEIVTIDLNKNFIQWSEENFSLNGFSNKESFQFWSSDCVQFLRGCEKRQRKFDLIICDPPTFSRNGNKVFRLEKDYRDLLRLIISCLNPHGRILFCTNYEKWSSEELATKTLNTDNRLKQLPPPLSGLDYEMPGIRPILKSVLLQLLDSL